jgi:hypothetical protein
MPHANGYPDLQQWVRHYGGYPNIPWDKWRAAVAGAGRPAEAPAAAEIRCAHCGDSSDEYGNRLLKVAYLSNGERTWAHAKCWPLYGAAPAATVKKLWHVCPTCGLAGPVNAPDGAYCLQHRRQAPQTP